MGNGWNDMGMVSMAGLSGTHTLLSREKVLCIPIFSNLNDGSQRWRCTIVLAK